MINLEVMNNYLAKPDESLASHTGELLDRIRILYSFEYISREIYEWTKKACFYHDIGKMSRAFQERINTGRHFNPNKEIGHNIVSKYLFALDYYKSRKREDIYEYSIISKAILNHHKYTDISEVVRNHNEVLNDTLKEIISSISEEEDADKVVKYIRRYVEGKASKCEAGITGKFTGKKTPESEEYNMNVRYISALLKKCDYSASAHLEIEFINDFLKYSLSELVKQFDSGWNEMQKFCELNTEKNLLIKGSTGLGKTEASLLWAGNNKIFYILPLKTAINSMYLRIKDGLLGNEKIEERLALLHGDMLSDYLEVDSENSKVVEDREFENIMNYYSLTKNYALPLSITTPDQIFRYVYNYFGSEVMKVTLSYSKIIVDEIQSYSADLLCYLIYGLQEVVKMGAKYAIITATLPPFVKDLLVIGKGGEDLSETMKYEEREFVNEIDRHNLCILEKEIDTDEIYNSFVKSMDEDDSSKFLVICNTIKKAQEVYNTLREKLSDYGGIEINMLHSKYTANDRAEKENRIISDGKTKTKKRVVWITTQVVEASLDIDFDYLFTELSDLNSLFQRMGRVNRKGMKSSEEHNCFVYTEIKKRHLNYGNSKGFIDGAIYEISREVLLELGNGKLSETKKMNLINENFTTSKIKEKNGVFLKDYDEYYEYISSLTYGEVGLHKAKSMFRNIVSYNIIPEKTYKEDRVLSELASKFNDINLKYEETKKSNIEYSEKSKVYRKLNKEKIEVVKKIKGYTIPVYTYDFNKEADSIKVSKYEKIYIVDCNYSKETGFVKAETDSKIEKTAENDIDDDIFL